MTLSLRLQLGLPSVPTIALLVDTPVCALLFHHRRRGWGGWIRTTECRSQSPVRWASSQRPNIKPKTGIEPVLSPQQLRNRTAWAITPLYHFSLLWHITRHRKSVELPIVRFAKMVGKMGLEPITHSMCNCCLCLYLSDKINFFYFQTFGTNIYIILLSNHVTFFIPK